jgi:hypothetical protein
MNAHFQNIDRQAQADLARLGILHNKPAADAAPALEAPEPLRRPVPPSKPYPTHSLGPLLAPAANALHRIVQSPLALCGQSVLAAAALAAQRLADVEIDGRVYPISLWCMTVAESGERKTATDGPALRAHRDFERRCFDQYRADKASHAEACKAVAKRNKQADAGAEEPEPEPPLLPHFIVAEPTLEGLHKLLMLGSGAVGLFTDEAAGFFGGHAMSKEHGAKSAAGFSGLWDRGEADRVRAADGAHKLFGKRLSMHLLLQPVIAERVLGDTMLSGQGFLARCLIAWPQGTAGSRRYSGESLGTDSQMLQFWNRMEALLRHPPRLADGTRNELEPLPFRLDPEARALWIKTHDLIEGMMGATGEYSQIRAWASKAPEQVLRVAGVFAAVEGTTCIDAMQIERAAEVVSWHLDEVVRLVGTCETPPEVRAGEAVLAWARERRRAFIYSSELVNRGPSCVRSADQLHGVMQMLARHGWVDPVEGGMVLDGKHRRAAWRLHPAAMEPTP